MVTCLGFWPDGRVGEIIRTYEAKHVTSDKTETIAVVDWRPDDGTRIHVAHHPLRELEKVG